MIAEVVIVALLIYIFVSEYFNRKERDRLTNKIMARDYSEYKNLEDTTPIEDEQPQEVPLSELSDDKFYATIDSMRQNLKEKVLNMKSNG